ncbi:MAG: ABC transporter ATP-binding protein [Candidatus Bathyarchaeia archaeon]
MHGSQRPFLQSAGAILLLGATALAIGLPLMGGRNPMDPLSMATPALAMAIAIYGVFRGSPSGDYAMALASALGLASSIGGPMGSELMALLAAPRPSPFLMPLLLYSFALLASLAALKPAAPILERPEAQSPVGEDLAVKVVDLTKVYKTGLVEVPALRGVNLEVRRGEFVCIVGPSGCGKSTLLNLLGALDKPSGGKIYIDGVDISRMNDGELAKFRNEKIGFVFQAYNLVSRAKVLQNVELPSVVKGLPRSERARKARDLLEAMGIGSKLQQKPTALSGGEQQRVAIARALMNDPTFVLADEPTGNLDSKTGREVWEMLRKANRERNATIIVVTHNLELARESDRIIYLRDGLVEREEILTGGRR